MLRSISIVLLFSLIFVSGGNVFGVHRVGSVSRLKGQESTTLTGVGLVTGLNGKGDKADFRLTGSMLGQLLALAGHSGSDAKALAAQKNVAVVRIQVTIPAHGAREGDHIDCRISAIGNATSLEGGVLDVTAMVGPMPSGDPERNIVFGLASGQVTIENDAVKTVGLVTRGCRLIDDFTHPYIDRNGCMTLVIDNRFARMPQMAVKVAEAVNRWGEMSGGENVATAVDYKNVIVKFPKSQAANPMVAVNQIMQEVIQLDENARIPTVRINERAGTIVIDEDVEFDPTSLSINGIDISPAVLGVNGQPLAPPQRFVPLDLEGERTGIPNPKLRALYSALNKVKVPTKDIIAIIKELDKSNRIHGVVEYE